MAQQRTSSRGMANQLLRQGMSRPALPPPRLTTNVYETQDGDAYVVEIAVPGLRPEEIVIEATATDLTVSTQPQQAEGEAGRRYVQRQQSPTPMSRVIEFPGEIDTDNIQANLEHGFLRIHVPKATAARRKVIRLG
jgi:HSP20 family protein